MFLTFHHSEVDSSARVLVDFAKKCHFISEVINQDISKLTLSQYNTWYVFLGVQ